MAEGADALWGGVKPLFQTQTSTLNEEVREGDPWHCAGEKGAEGGTGTALGVGAAG